MCSLTIDFIVINANLHKTHFIFNARRRHRAVSPYTQSKVSVQQLNFPLHTFEHLRANVAKYPHKSN